MEVAGDPSLTIGRPIAACVARIAPTHARLRQPASHWTPPAALDLETRLMLRVRAGDRDAFRLLLERNRRRVLGLARRYGFDPALAEDVAQETFLRIYAARERYRPERRFSSWMFTIATNLCLTHARRSSRGGRQDRLGSVPEPIDRRASGRRPDEHLLESELRGLVRDAVSDLPARQRVAISLQRLEERSYHEVAVDLGLTVPATKSLLHRARLALKDTLVDYQAA